MAEENTGGLSEVETAYFESGGEKPLVTEQVETIVEKAAPETGTVEETAEQKAERDRDDKGRFVNHGAFHAEREERKKFEAEARELRDWKARVEERFRIAEEQKKGVEQPDDPFAGLDEEDYVGTIKQLKNIIVQDRQQKTQQTAAQRAEAEHRERVMRTYDAVNERFIESERADPELTDAYSYTKNSFAAEMRAAGMGEQEVNQRLEAIAVNFALTIAQKQMDPAEFTKNIAKARGWQPKAKEPTRNEVADKLDKIGQAQEQSRTIGQASGKAAGDPDSLESILSMSKTEFEVWHADPKNARRFDKLMGA